MRRWRWALLEGGVCVFVEKNREFFRLDGCDTRLDNGIGRETSAEIEGPDAAVVDAVTAKLGPTDKSPCPENYAARIAGKEGTT